MHIINLSGFTRVKDNIQKSHVEGYYSNTSANKKLGRVGMSYKEYSEKSNKKDNIKENTTFKIQNDDILFEIKEFDENNKLIGKVKSTKDEDGALYLDLIQIEDTKDRTKGLGTKLMQKFLSEVKKDKSIIKIYLTVDGRGFKKEKDSLFSEDITPRLLKWYQGFGFKFSSSSEKNEQYPELVLNRLDIKDIAQKSEKESSIDQTIKKLRSDLDDFKNNGQYKNLAFISAGNLTKSSNTFLQNTKNKIANTLIKLNDYEVFSKIDKQEPLNQEDLYQLYVNNFEKYERDKGYLSSITQNWTAKQTNDFIRFVLENKYKSLAKKDIIVDFETPNKIIWAIKEDGSLKQFAKKE